MPVEYPWSASAANTQVAFTMNDGVAPVEPEQDDDTDDERDWNELDLDEELGS